MAELRSGGPYIWVSWLTRLLSGENSCEWAQWFKSQHDSATWTKVTSDFDQAAWVNRHTNLLISEQEKWEGKGYKVYREDQNSFYLKGSTATVAGKADLIAVMDNHAVVIDAKTGKPGPSHALQVLVYMYAIPRALSEYGGMTISGNVAYETHDIPIAPAEITSRFTDSLIGLIRRLADSQPARKVPSRGDCRFCDITSVDCPERIEYTGQRAGSTTTDF